MEGNRRRRRAVRSSSSVRPSVRPSGFLGVYALPLRSGRQSDLVQRAGVGAQRAAKARAVVPT